MPSPHNCLSCVNFRFDITELYDPYVTYRNACAVISEEISLNIVGDNLCGMFNPRYGPTKPSSKVVKKPKKERYVSQDGFELIPMRRGFTSIRPLWTIMEDVKLVSKKDCFICGGYARWCASPKSTPALSNDIDVYCENLTVFETMRNFLSGAGLVTVHENAMALTYKQPTFGDFHTMSPIQLIKPVENGAIVARGSKEKIISNFDFTIIRAAIVTPTTVLVDKDFIHDETSNNLRLKNIHCPVSSLLRCLKYAARGYWLRPMESLKLFTDWTDRSDEYRGKLLGFLESVNGGEDLTKKQVDELEALMRID